MKNSLICFYLLLVLGSCKEPSLKETIDANPMWKTTELPSKASFRGISAVDNSVCWVSGSLGQVWVTTDGGETWSNRAIPNMDTLQFRDIKAFNKDTVLVLSAGLPAVIMKTMDGGVNWKNCYLNTNEGIFFDAFDFWDKKNGIAFSDATDSSLFIIKTIDGGETWYPILDSVLPNVHYKQGGFAASGSCLITYTKGKVIIGLGGPEATLLLGEDFGNKWHKSISPLDFGEASKGNFSFSIIDSTLFCVGGDYLGDSLSENTIARSEDFGLSWSLVTDSAVSGKYRSSIVQINKDTIFTSSRTGTSYSLNGGETWVQISGSYFSLSKGVDGSLWASGSKGKVAKLEWLND